MSKRRVFNSVALAAALLSATGCTAGDEEAKKFIRDLSGARVTVYPAVVRSGASVTHDPAAARGIAAALGKAGAKEVVVSTENLVLSGKRSFNQAAMFQASFSVFAGIVKSRPPETEFAAVAEYLTSPSGAAGGIHLYVVRRDGSRAFGRLLNSHHKSFKAVMPVNNQQATSVLIRVLEDDLTL